MSLLLSLALAAGPVAASPAPQPPPALQTQAPARWQVLRLELAFQVAGRGLVVESLDGATAEALTFNAHGVNALLGPWVEAQGLMSRRALRDLYYGTGETGGHPVLVLHRDNRLEGLPRVSGAARLTGIQVDCQDPRTGQIQRFTLDPREQEAFFWSDRAVLDILAPFYDQEGAGKVVQSGHLFRGLQRGETLQRPMNSQALRRLWMNGPLAARQQLFGLAAMAGETSEGELGPCGISKSIRCNPTGQP